MRQIEVVRREGAQFSFAGFPAMAFGLFLLMFLGLSTAHAQSPVGTAESCFEAGPDHVPTFTEAPVPPVRPGLPAQIRTVMPVAISAAIPAGASAPALRLIPAKYTPLKEMPIHMLNAGYKDRYTPALRKSPEFLASAR
jgi:hypothetical protein